MTTSRKIASATLALALLLCACSPPKTQAQYAQEAARAAEAAADHASTPFGDSLLSPAALAQAQEGTLRGYRDEATRLSIHYMLDGPVKANAPEPRRWISLAAATGASLAIENHVLVLSYGGAPADCAEARVRIAEAKTLYAREIAAATAKNLRDAKIEALDRIRDVERQMADSPCGTGGR